MKREDIKIGMKVTPHNKTHPDFPGLKYSGNWKRALETGQNYLFVNRIQDNYNFILGDETGSSGDYFLPEDFEPYIEDNVNQENNNESGDVKMKKSELNSSMLFKMRDGSLCVLLPDSDNNQTFCDKEDIEQGYSSYFITLNDYDEDLTPEDDDYDIVAIRHCSSCVKAIHYVLEEVKIKEWDWEEETKKEESKAEESQTPVIHNITINLTLDSDNFDPANFLEQINDALEKIKKEVK